MLARMKNSGHGEGLASFHMFRTTLLVAVSAILLSFFSADAQVCSLHV